MEKVFIVSEDTALLNFLQSASKYGKYLDNIEFVRVTGASNITERNTCVIIDKSDYELEVLRLLAKKMYLIICTEGGKLQIDIEEDNKILVVDKPYVEEQLYSSLKLILEYKNMAGEFDKNKDTEIDVRRAAETDYLTGLPNRRGMYEYFGIGLKSATVHCMFIDIDNFKKINDTYGHKIGDKLLVKVSQLVKGKIGDAFFARLSGDEFAIIIEGSVPKAQVVAMAEDIIGSTDEIQIGVDVSSIISFSIGIMLEQSSQEDLDDILLRCDVAMYEAKKSGKGRYVIYNDIAHQVEYKMNVDRDKSNALITNQFKIYLQPRMNMVTLGIEGVEAGIFWEHPKDGLRAPDDFIEILEEDSFIVELEKRMLNELCKIMETWKGTILESFPVYFRISKKHLYQKQFVKHMNDCMEHHGLKPENLCIGLTEIDIHPKVTEAIVELRESGFEVSCVKSVSNTKSAFLNVNDTLAGEWLIEKELIGNMADNRTSLILTRSVISLARELNIQIVSRGITDSQQMSLLTKYGCDVAVGEYFTKPLRPEEFLEYALSHVVEKNNTYIYEFDGNLSDQNGEHEGKFVGDECGFKYDEELKKQVISFPGANVKPSDGGVLENFLELPTTLLDSRDYTVSLSVRVEEHEMWKSIFYTEFANGFCSVMPYVWDGSLMFRIKDHIYEDEWNDIIGRGIEAKKWYFITITYNNKKHEGRMYVNGELSARAEGLNTVENPARVVVGGDVWQGVFHGEVGHVIVHDYVVSSEEAHEEYEQYMGHLKVD